MSRAATGRANKENISINYFEKIFQHTCLCWSFCWFYEPKYCPAAGHLDSLSSCNTGAGESSLGRDSDCQHCPFRHWSPACQVTQLAQDRTAFNRKYLCHSQLPHQLWVESFIKMSDQLSLRCAGALKNIHISSIIIYMSSLLFSLEHLWYGEKVILSLLWCTYDNRHNIHNQHIK